MLHTKFASNNILSTHRVSARLFEDMQQNAFFISCFGIWWRMEFKFCSCYLLQEGGWQRKKKIEKFLISLEWKDFWSEIRPFHWPNKSIKLWSIGNILCGHLLIKLLVQKFNSYLRFFESNFLKGIHCSNNPHCNINLITTHILTSIFRLVKIMKDLVKSSLSWCF